MPDFRPPREVERLSTFAELLAWAVGVWGVIPGDRTLVERKSPLPVKQSDATAVVARALGVPLSPAGTPEYKRVRSRVNNLYRGVSIAALRVLCPVLGVPIDVTEYLERRWSGREFPRRSGTFNDTGLSVDRVRKAIDASERMALRERWPRDIRPVPYDESGESGSAVYEVDEPPAAVARIRLRLRGGALAPVLDIRGLELRDDDDAADDVLIATDGSLLARFTEGAMQIARVNRVTGSTTNWGRPIDLTGLGDGRVLAVDSAGDAEVGFVWAGAAGTALFVARRTDLDPISRGAFSDHPATLAVLHGSRALLAWTALDGTTRCRAFPGLHVRGLAAASRSGGTLVLATGVDETGHDACMIEVDGRARSAVPSSTLLELLLGSREPPIAVADGAVVALSPASGHEAPYSRWTSAAVVRAEAAH